MLANRLSADPGNRVLLLEAGPRGRGLGGCSSINGLIFVRGQHEDYDRWASAGNKGWSWKDVLPYFLRSEDNSRGASEYHGTGGPVACTDIAAKNELIEAVLKGATEIGIPRNDDFNVASQAHRLIDAQARCA